LRIVADQLRDKWPKLVAFIDESEADVLAHMNFCVQHRVKIYSTNPIERLNKEVKRRTDVAGIVSQRGLDHPADRRRAAEANDEWQTQHRYMQTEAMAALTPTTIDAVPHQITTQAA